MNRFFAGLILLLVLSIGCGKMQSANNDISVGGIDLGNMSRTEAETKLNPMAMKLLDREIVFVEGEKSYRASLRELGADTNVKDILDNIYTPLKGEIQQTDFDLKVKLDANQAAERIRTLTADLNTPASDAYFSVKPNNRVEVIPHNFGTKVDLEAALAELDTAVRTGTGKVYLRTRKTEPAVKSQELEKQKFDGLIASFSTSFSPSNKNRTENLKKAAETLDMFTLKPGEIFSFNEVVGERNEEAGYKESLIIIENEYVMGTGGGVCQVSSTLYNLALLGDLEIMERHPHKFSIPYLPPGKDATVFYPQLDLKFRNNTGALLLIRTKVKGSSLTMSLYGKRSNKKVEIQTVVEGTEPFEIERRIDPKLAPGVTEVDQTGSKGYKTKTYRIVKKGGKVIKREEVSKDNYKPANKIFRVGPAKTGNTAWD